MEDAEVDRGVIPGPAFANRAVLVARVGLNKVRMEMTNADFEIAVRLLRSRSYQPAKSWTELIREDDL